MLQGCREEKDAIDLVERLEKEGDGIGIPCGICITIIDYMLFLVNFIRYRVGFP